MITISINPIIFNIGHFALRWYSLILLVAIVIGVWLTAREAERKVISKNAYKISSNTALSGEAC